MEKMIQLAIQYLISAQHSFRKDEETAFNNCLNFCLDDYCIKTKNLTKSNAEITLQLNYDDFSLEWKNISSKVCKLTLNNRSHREIVSWLSKTAQEAKLSNPYVYLHNTKDVSPRIRELFVFRNINKQELHKHLDFQLVIQRALKEVITEYDLHSQVYIWGVKQGTALYALLNPEIDLVINLGMLYNDPLSSENKYNVYAKGWRGFDQIKPIEFPKLQKGQWYDSTWNGALLSLGNPDKNLIKNFFYETIHAFRQNNLISVA